MVREKKNAVAAAVGQSIFELSSVLESVKDKQEDKLNNIPDSFSANTRRIGECCQHRRNAE